MSLEELYKELGANYQEAKTRLMNDVLITKFLRKFATDYKIDALIAAAEAGDAHGIFEACHSLKGVAGNLALTNLYDLASALTEKTRGLSEGSKVEVKDEVLTLSKEFQRTVDLIKQVLGL